MIGREVNDYLQNWPEQYGQDVNDPDRSCCIIPLCISSSLIDFIRL